MTPEEAKARLKVVNAEIDAWYWTFTRSTGRNLRPIDPALTRERSDLEDFLYPAWRERREQRQREAEARRKGGHESWCTAWAPCHATS